MRRFSVGDLVVYHKPKTSSHPGPRSEDIHPAEHGEDYTYAVDKYWTVSKVFDDGTLEVMTRRGKAHRLEADDPRLRKASLREQWLHRSRFPELSSSEEQRDD